MEESPQKHLPNALFVCSRCRKLCIATELNWNAAFRNHRRQTFSTKTPRRIQLHCGKDFKWEYYDQFLEDKEIFQKREQADFPICNKCANLKLEQINCQRDYLKYESDPLSKNMPNVSLDIIKQLKHKTEKLKKEIQVYREVFESSSAGSDVRIETLSPSIPRDESFRSKAPDTLMLRQNPNENLKVNTFVACTTFVISSNGHYGTINELRLGTQTPTPVPLEEINSGLMLLCQILNYYLSITKAYIFEIHLGPEMTFKIHDHEYTLTAFDLKHKKSVKRFNEAMDIIMSVFSHVFVFFDSGQPRPPFLIKPKDKTIGGESYEYELKHPEKWTLAMKYLLANLKSAQVQGLRCSLIQYQKSQNQK
ncbi:hypothetical protein TVAG_049850 [Trichomonas vaginalis G3]|uniref:Atg6 BARA domain-containing protein n=1 Tax=Trichomonas vaginalis (strain ATCC PRA-98 / G3) TaxID=412133 RepID=A2EVY0_TRIV3|nr:beclin 1 family [Trichomonas vaginalis G3]EAY03201.1 hypothetical protein TVAG_049850 [Trichomonas vaginalis G3]KAI5520353.1 beclin 1 family [Trichomonas vaginalis G3]|eukprot:XP_001315424.1 hypothetical protein [Trichomonas vaginalis G3]